MRIFHNRKEVLGRCAPSRRFAFAVFLATGCMSLAACQEDTEFEGGSGGGGTPGGWVNLGGGGAGDRDSDADGDSDATADAGPAGGCMLTGEVGLGVGDLAPDLTLYRCDDTPVQAHRLFCDSPYTFLYSYAEW